MNTEMSYYIKFIAHQQLFRSYIFWNYILEILNIQIPIEFHSNEIHNYCHIVIEILAKSIQIDDVYSNCNKYSIESIILNRIQFRFWWHIFFLHSITSRVWNWLQYNRLWYFFANRIMIKGLSQYFFFRFHSFFRSIEIYTLVLVSLISLSYVDEYNRYITRYKHTLNWRLNVGAIVVNWFSLVI